LAFLPFFVLAMIGLAAILLFAHALLVRRPKLPLPESKSSEPLAYPSADAPIGERYLDLLKRRLVRFERGGRVRRTPLSGPLNDLLQGHGLEIVQVTPTPQSAYEDGSEQLPEDAETMIGLKRLTQLQEATRDVVARGVPGDLLEAGAWRGGATILMRAALEVYGDRKRSVWVADSFDGLPRPDIAHYPLDAGWLNQRVELATPLDTVKDNFRMYGWLDERVRFLPGWFKKTLPNAPIERLAILRVDADMYESTMQALQFLYPKVSPGGIVIVDDYALDTCKIAVDDFRRERGITAPMTRIDWTGVFWIKPEERNL
jgi:O-methyltransferase